MFERLAHRRARNYYRLGVWVSISELCQFADERQLATLLPQKYPGIRAVIDEGQTANETPERIAIQIFASVLANEIETTLAPQRRMLVLYQLRHLDEIKKTPEEDALTARIRWAEPVTYRWVELGKITEQERDFLMSEIIGALDGQSAAERHGSRMAKIIDDALLPGWAKSTHGAG